jgi:hypothetical protein
MNGSSPSDNLATSQLVKFAITFIAPSGSEQMAQAFDFTCAFDARTLGCRGQQVWGLHSPLSIEISVHAR